MPLCYPAPICNFDWRHFGARSQQSDLGNGWKSTGLAQALMQMAQCPTAIPL
ncbi:hypothetical protein [Acinetobacter bouvetii]|uniref:hypothetical protein n=1 Tax=Acinetobacter bouvetii TaxID=202951 RepID=UPI00037CAB22|nr:hypothetical protein [Acinetobacter bouvetii]